MNQLNSILLQASQGGGMSGMIMIVAMIVIFYFFMIRPQSKKQKEIKKAREAMTKGDKVVTAGGIQGRIVRVDEYYFEIEIAPKVTIRVDKASVYPYAAPQPSGKTPAKKEEPAKSAREIAADTDAEQSGEEEKK